MSDPIEIGPLMIEVSLERKRDESIVKVNAWRSATTLEESSTFLGTWDFEFKRECQMRHSETNSTTPDTEQ